MSTDEWCTPKWLADEVGPFDLDPASNRDSHIRAKRSYWVERDEDGLTAPWRGSLWLNPPYSKPLPWCKRLAAHDAPWCALLKLDPTTRWYETLANARASFAPFRKRIKFEGSVSMTANFPSVLVWRDWTPPDAMAVRLWMPRSER